MLRRLATAVVCVLLTAIPHISPPTEESDIAASERFTGPNTPSSQRARLLEGTVLHATAESDSYPAMTPLNSRDTSGLVAASTRAEPEPRGNDALPRNAPPITPRSIAKLARAAGSWVEEQIGAADDAGLFGEDYDPPPPKLTRETTCFILEEVAAENELPRALFTRLIWQESRFRPDVVSHAGAQGIAQFMPATADERGLEDPFDPMQALPASAEFLRDLMRRFGNFGLAAAAYNGGPGRVSRWLAGTGGLPEETRNYVIQITGRTAEHWSKFADAEPHPEAVDVSNCEVSPLRVAITEAREEEKKRRERAATVRIVDKTTKSGDKNAIPTPAKRPRDNWIAALSGNWSEKKARAMFARLQKKYPKVLGPHSPTVRVKSIAGKKAPKTIVGIIADTRAEAQKVCQRLKEAGGACVVQKDPAA